MTVSALSGVAALGGHGGANAAEGGARDVYELRSYTLETEAQKAGLEAFMADACIPALNRLGITPVGVFETADALSPVYVLLRHPSLESVAALRPKLAGDAEYLSKGAAFLDAPAAAPAYKRVESSLLIAFTGMPQLEVPSKAPGRVLQLRIYESPSIKTNQKKIEMFNTAELAIFRRTGLKAVFFGEAIAGAKMPNLTYMLSFDSPDAQKAAWDAFRADPDWLKLRAMPEYDDKAILCGITNLLLKPAACSQV